MNGWVQTIIEKVTPSTNKPIIVIDSQKYLEIAEIQELLKREGYELIFVDCGIQVRIKYELEVKDREKVILAIDGNYNLIDDMKSSASVIDLKPKDVFCNFDEKAIVGLSYNALSVIDSIRVYEELTYEDTIRFLLENLYGIDLYAWQHNKSKERCLAILISVYTNTEKPNQAINDFLESMSTPFFGDKIKNYITTDRFPDFINELQYDEINLKNPMLSKELANLRMKGIIENDVISSPQTIDLQNLSKELFAFLEERIKTIGDQYKDWFEIAPKLGELGYIVYELKNKDLITQYYELIANMNSRFQLFIKNHYESLFSMSGLRHPITIDKVQDYIAANIKNCKMAFIVVDGMNYWQWIILKHKLEKLSLKIDEKPSLTWIPSITAWARQAIFAGTRPNLSIDNRTEAALFKNYWIEKKGKLKHQVIFEVIKKEQKINVPSSDVTVAGFVTNGLDDLMHGNILGNEQLFINTNLWIEKTGICDSIKELRDAGFEVYISTDHGNVEAELKLKLSAGQKSLIHSKSKRFILFDTDEQAVTYIQNNANYQLGKRDKTVYFKDTNGFGTTNDKVITHGGSHILEVLIPVGRIR